MYLGIVEVKENRGGRPHSRHKQTTSKEESVETKDGYEQGPAPHSRLLILNLL